jgi:CelD/BcsL family acetyltransferase involved in cellulose biosynthesis
MTAATAQPANDNQVDVIADIAQYDNLRQNWHDVYAACPHATVFMSWQWLRGWIETTPYTWLVLATRDTAEGPYSGFFPLGYQAIKLTRFHTSRKLVTGGFPWADHSGFICLPGREANLVTACARYLQTGPKWYSFDIRHASHEHMLDLVALFNSDAFQTTVANPTSCSYIKLPRSWDAYKSEMLSKKTRSTLVNYENRMKRDLEFHLTDIEDQTYEQHVETLLQLWCRRWNLGPDDVFMGSKTSDLLKCLRSIYRRCHDNKLFALRTLWDGQNPIAAIAAFLDDKTKTVTAYTSAYNVDYYRYSPGMIMMGFCIRFAIDNKYDIFDFGSGTEDYKSHFGPEQKFDQNITLVSKRHEREIGHRIVRHIRALRHRCGAWLNRLRAR